MFLLLTRQSHGLSERVLLLDLIPGRLDIHVLVDGPRDGRRDGGDSRGDGRGDGRGEGRLDSRRIVRQQKEYSMDLF